MQFPITRERLHHIDVEYIPLKKKEYVDKLVNKFTEEIINRAWNSTSIEGVAEPAKHKRQFVVHGKDIDMSDMSVSEVCFDRKDCMNAIVEEMKKRVPDMVIVQDPLGTYILFDWN